MHKNTNKKIAKMKSSCKQRIYFKINSLCVKLTLNSGTKTTECAQKYLVNLSLIIMFCFLTKLYRFGMKYP